MPSAHVLSLSAICAGFELPAHAKFSPAPLRAVESACPVGHVAAYVAASASSSGSYTSVGVAQCAQRASLCRVTYEGSDMFNCLARARSLWHSTSRHTEAASPASCALVWRVVAFRKKLLTRGYSGPTTPPLSQQRRVTVRHASHGSPHDSRVCRLDRKTRMREVATQVPRSMCV